MKYNEVKNRAPDMGRFLLSLPVGKIVLLSWIVSEYNGLGLVTTELFPWTEHSSPLENRQNEGVVSLFFPQEKREDVLELLLVLKADGLVFRVLSEYTPISAGSQGETAEKPEESKMI